MVIGIRGGIKAGKDTVTQLLIDKLEEKYSLKFENRKFGDKLKDIVALLLGCSREDLESQQYKETPLGSDWNHYKVNGDGSKILYPTFKDASEATKRSYGIRMDIMVEEVIMTPRLILQLLATEGGRHLIHPNMWCNALFSEYTDDLNWLISDCRFINEVEYIKKNGGILIDIKRLFSKRYPQHETLCDGNYGFNKDLETVNPELYKVLTHISETELNRFSDFDFTLYNNGSIIELNGSIDDILTSIVDMSSIY